MAWQELGGANTGLPNNAIDANIHWLGTTDNDPLIIRTENGPLGAGNAPNPRAEVMRITPADPMVLESNAQPRCVGIGTTKPEAKLHVEWSDVGPSVQHAIHSGGTGAGLSFASQNAVSGYQAGEYVPDGQDGSRWAWYAYSDDGETSSARLWSRGDRLFITGAYGQVLVHANTSLPPPDGRDLRVMYPEVPIGTLTFRSTALGGGRVPPDPPVPGELVLGGVRTSIRGFDGDRDDPTASSQGSLRYGHHWIRTNGNHFEHWMAFRREPPGPTWPFPRRTLEAAVSWYGPSFNDTSCDERVKTNVRQLEGALDKLKDIRGVAFESAETESLNALGGVPGQPSIGVVAQEVEEVFPEVVSIYEPDQEYRAVDYNGLTGVLIEAVKELKAQNEDLRSRIEALERA